MINYLLIKILLIEYVVVLIVCLFERNWYRALYWLGASLIQIGILGMK